MAPLRLAVLECDTPMDVVLERYGRYGDIFERDLQLAATRLNCKVDSLVVLKWDVVNTTAYPEPDDIDAVLLTGSREYCRSRDGVYIA